MTTMNAKSFVSGCIFVFSSGVAATPVGDTYLQVTRANCSSSSGNISMDLQSQELRGEITGGGRTLALDFAPIKQEAPEIKVEVIRDFLDSGYDFLGSPVATAGEDTLGTYAIALDKPLSSSPNQAMTVVYIEAMTGWQLTAEMACSFK